jgi:hypothetical protein
MTGLRDFAPQDPFMSIPVSEYEAFQDALTAAEAELEAFRLSEVSLRQVLQDIEAEASLPEGWPVPNDTYEKRMVRIQRWANEALADPPELPFAANAPNPAFDPPAVEEGK